ncbi:enoyl-CoA hydratase/isomerase family protein [Paenalcaligenes niemegkensis]|uniref:enoyl-CoA hydratase/isomerase family protein n=1 Tax=Paenalcaligenes niemegkensis TaxID=2895469 RepID=UPI001EE89385|nr:enoyl-CoA hydratase/isomerase family protein [Paenalcaligenes niemegkensis]MCQ9616303.1 enoyl-CoA hydratase/isomerase family protein [Paenalcaligenes niemegkensis]
MAVTAVVLPLRGTSLTFGVLTLDRPEALNSLNLDMVTTLHAQLSKWQGDQEIAFVIIQGQGERAFCAGGDITTLYKSLLSEAHRVFEPQHYAYRFFKTEYELNALIHHYRKPIVALGQGVVMGGGVGLFMGASHKVVFANTRYAMPEVAIGLYPDVAGTWLLGRLPKGVGKYVALTGTSLNGHDCCFLRLADSYVDKYSAGELIALVSDYAYDTNLSSAGNVNRLLTGVDRQWDTDQSPIAAHFHELRDLSLSHSVADFTNKLDKLHAGSHSEVIEAGRKSLAYASPLSTQITWQLLTTNRTASVSQTLERDFWVSLQCCSAGDFKEGVRALLIDKDRTPRWRPLESIDTPLIDTFCQPSWTGAAPLAL